MHKSIQKQFESYLYNKAKELSSSRSIPVSIDAICDEFGVTIIRKNPVRKKSYLLELENNYEIQLPLRNKKNYNYVTDEIYLTGDGYLPFERYIIAHELGHLLLINKFSLKPYGKEEYWKLEALCDFFARSVLIPEDFISKKIKSAQDTLRQRLGLVAFIAKTTKATWPAAADRVVDYNKRYAFFRIIISSDKTHTPVFQINSSTLQGKSEIGRKIKPQEDELGRLFFSKLINNQSEFQLDKKFFENLSILKEFPSFENAKAGLVVYAYKKIIYMAVQYIS